MAMRVLVIADDDSVRRNIGDAGADVVISCGDLADDTVLEVGRRSGARSVLAVKGNHDSSAEFAAPIQNLHMTCRSVGAVRIGGFCGAWRYKTRGNFLFEQDEVEHLLASFPPVDVFIAHNSPRGVHDREDDVHLGFEAFNRYIERAKPALFIHGHQHVDAETLLGSTRVIGVYGYRRLEV